MRRGRGRGAGEADQGSPCAGQRVRVRRPQRLDGLRGLRTGADGTKSMARTGSAAKRKAGGRIFRYSAWDAVPAALVYVHLGLLLAFFIAWPQLGWGWRLAGAGLYAFAIGWNQDSVSHNFIHNPFFTSKLLNRITEFALTLENGVPQTMYAYVHMRHHAGNSDRPDGKGRTIEPISIYRNGADGRAEPMLRYVLMGFWRDDDPFSVAREIGRKRPAEAKRAMHEFWV